MTIIAAPKSGEAAEAASGTAQFKIGTKVSCTSGPCGKLTRVIIDPIRRSLTHLVVEPHVGEAGRLVPLSLVEYSSADKINLSCTLSELGQLAPSVDTDYFPPDDRYFSYYDGYARGYGYGYASFWPYYGYGGLGYGYGWGPDRITYDAIPSGEVTVRRGEPVHATDGDIGRVAGLVIGTPDGKVTHVLLQEGHLWGKKDVAIPIHSVAGAGDAVEVSMTKHEIGDLPSVDIDHPEINDRTV